MTLTLEKLYNTIYDYLSRWLSALFTDWKSTKRTTIIGWIGIVLLYALGIYFWATLFDRGHTPLNYHDWAVINMPRLDAIRDAFQFGRFPFHIQCETCLHKLTDRFLVLPDVITTPQMVALPFLGLTRFVFFDLVLHYTVGTLGLLYLQRKFNLSLLAYSVLFFLFNFNGHIQAHLAVGHETWNAYFLFPWFFVLVFQLVEGKANWSWVAKLAFLSLYMVLAGGEHHFIWMMLFLSILAILQIRLFKWAVTGIFFSGFLSAIRLLPPLLMINTFVSNTYASSTYWSEFAFRTGYPGISGVLSALFMLRPPDYEEVGLTRWLGYWEFDYFVGFLGAFLIIYFGVIRWVQDQKTQKRFAALLAPTAILFLLTQGSFYQYTLFNIPLLAGERAPTRMVTLPLTLLMIIGTILFQEWLREKDSSLMRWITGLSLVYLVNELYTHLLLWKIDNLASFLEQPATDLSGNSIVLRSDPPYTLILLFGLALTSITALLLFFLVKQEKRRMKSKFIETESAHSLC